MDEKEILKFWKENRIYEKSKKKNSGREKFYFMDGPPYATGSIHMGTALNKILKDIAMRGQRLQGKDVFDRPGYDTHGVPIEFQIEKEIGSRTKKDIERYGVKKFIEKCKEYATKHISIMNSEFENLGVWMDFTNPYLTLSEEYIETIWDVFKEADRKKLLYLGQYPIHVCPRCETAVAYNEIEYQKQEDNSIFVKFPLKKRKSFLIIWTTTPWTLPGNSGVMVNPNFDYQEIELSNGERWILAKEMVPKIAAELELGYRELETFKGKDMDGWEYENPLKKNLNIKTKNAYKVVLSSRYVNLEEGTGLVHCAPGHGKEDYEVGKENNLDVLCPVTIEGVMTEEAGKYSGGKAREIDEEIIKDLEKEGYLVRKLKYKHDYPICWRCKSPLLMISLPQWFLKISEIHSSLLKENENTNWIPKWMKLRMKAWLEGISDWPVSRKRYWGTPLPIWICNKCNKKKVVGTKAELEKLAGRKIGELHKPEIDDVTFKCTCGGEMKRVEEVLDVWFDSGVSSWAAVDYIKNKKQFEKFWPADLNVEGKDQVRGWWNSQLILSQIKFNKKPFENIMVHGMVLDLGKKKMSKSKGNAIKPEEVIEKYNRDYLRYYFAKISKGEDFAFDERYFKDIQKVFRVLVNVNNFVNQLDKNRGKESIEDRWILNKFYFLVENVRKNYNEFKFPELIQQLEEFLVVDLSRNYIQFIRERQDEVYEVLNEIRIGLLKLFSPIIPFTTERIWQELRESGDVSEESVHLTEFPERKSVDMKLVEKFNLVLEAIEKGLAERDKNKIGLKWPLKKAVVYSDGLEGLEGILKRQLNVKEVEFRKGKLKVELDTKQTKELEAEGYARELSRKIQAERKKMGLVKSDEIKLELNIDTEFKNLIESQIEFIKSRVNAKEIIFTDKEFKTQFEIKDKKISINF